MENPIVGTGILILDGERHFGAKYQIVVRPVGRSKLRADGLLSLPTGLRHVLMRTFAAGYAQIELEGGQVVEIVPTHMRVPSDPPSLEFTAAGPLPGYGA